MKNLFIITTHKLPLSVFNLSIISNIFLHGLLEKMMAMQHKDVTVTLIFPHQLFKKHPAVLKGRRVYLIEEYLYFNQYNFHKQKLVLHRASMKFYEDFLTRKGYEVIYIECTDSHSDVRKLLPHLLQTNVTQIHYCDTVDNWLEKRIRTTLKDKGVQLHCYPTPYFLNEMEEMSAFFDKRKTYFHNDFYIWQRKQKKLLLEAGNEPIGGRWTYDTENRERFPKTETAPPIPMPAVNKFVTEAREYIERNFTNNYGMAGAPFEKKISLFEDDTDQTDNFFAVTFEEAEKALDIFLKDKLFKFGIYEDAMVKDAPVLYHSVLSPLLNIGLITPKNVIDQTLQTAAEQNIPMNSLEGFIRQVMGWREYIRIVYEREGSVQRTKNYWGFTRKIPVAFWKGETGIHPVDTVIKRLLRSGYTHHIERLMVLGNFFLLCEFDPGEVYRWFMEMYVDSYDWVMVPNVYGMTQFADGGLMTTKPYISGSNYLMKMGDWNKGPWQEIWDGLFWRFMYVHRAFFLKNPRLGMLIKSFDKMDVQKQQKHLQIADSFLLSLDKA